MELIVANRNLIDIKLLDHVSFDFECGGTNDFKVVIDQNYYNSDVQMGNFIYSTESECGGIIGEIDTDTSLETISLLGHTWRGLLSKKIIIPNGDYTIVSGELHTVMKSLVSDCFTKLFFVSSENTGVTISNYQFERYCTLLDGLKDMLKSVNYRLNIRYVQGPPGYVELSAVPIVDYSSEIELSQDSRVFFIMKNIQNGINHLICLGDGELSERTVVDLYVDNNGNISQNKYYSGIDELIEVYDYPNAQDIEKLIESGTDRLESLKSNSTFEMDVSSLNLSVGIGDIVGGRDYITGNVMSKPVAIKVYREEDDVLYTEYTLEDDKKK